MATLELPQSAISPWKSVTVPDNSTMILFRPKDGVTFEQQKQWLETTYPEEHWRWRLMGHGTADPVVCLWKVTPFHTL